ncbi:nitroreductase family protein [Methylobacillus sp. Pita2]|uniref:nitroreductase family protein n=1 Tax=Methylobacillus sp. Pita2 TaxID=3383245 RepID=UPI0038B6B1FD
MSANTVVNSLKPLLFKIPGLQNNLRKYKEYYGNLKTRFISYKKDFVDDWKYLGWRRTGVNYWKLSSELIFYYHKLEKGLCLPPENRRWFGVLAAEKTLHLLYEWERVNLPKDAAVYQAACAVLQAYWVFAKSISDTNAEAKAMATKLEFFLQSRSFDAQYQTPIGLQHAPSGSFDVLHQLSLSRRSTRNFLSKPIDLELVTKAVEVAQLSPSACNRQPWKIHIYSKREDIDSMLALQNGNRGFGHKVPMLAVMCCDLGSFFDSTERFEPHLDGGLFLMSFILALQAQGIASCCLNWCVNPDKDSKAHEVGNILPSERILTFLAVGYPAENVLVPLSARRPLADVLIKH